MLRRTEIVDVVPAKAGTHTPQLTEGAGRMGPGASAGTTLGCLGTA